MSKLEIHHILEDLPISIKCDRKAFGNTVVHDSSYNSKPAEFNWDSAEMTIECLKLLDPQEGDRIILRSDIWGDIASHCMQHEAFHKYVEGLKLKDIKVEQAHIEEIVQVMHKDSDEYKYFRAVLAL